MKLPLILSLFLSTASLGLAGKFTNTFAIYLVADNLPREQIIDGTATPKGLRLMPSPLISDADLLSYNTMKHGFTVTRTAAERIAQQCTRSIQVPFVLVAAGEPVYVGVFTTVISSSSSGVPAILTDHLRVHAQDKEAFQIDRGYPSDDSGRGEDRRNDKRVISAIEKLFPKPASNK